MGKYMPSIWFKISNTKTPHLTFCRFFRQPMTKLMEKTAFWTIFGFSALPSLKKV